MLGFLAALQFLTILPIKRDFTPEQIGRSTVFFPLVGLVIGLILAGLNYVLSLILPSAAVNVLLIAGFALLSGGLHLDGLADTFDGMAGHRTPEQRLDIMRDSRIGGYGAMALALVLLIQYVTLNVIPDNLKMNVLILAPALSRWAMVYAIYVYPYARPEGLGRAFKDQLWGLEFALDTVITLLVALILYKLGGIAIMVGAWLATDVTSFFLTRKLKGLTGDTYGAINEIVVSMVFIVLAVLAFKHWLV